LNIFAQKSPSPVWSLRSTTKATAILNLA